MARYKFKSVQIDPIGEERIMEIRERYICDSEEFFEVRGDSVLEDRSETVRFIRFHFRKDKDLL